MSKNFTIIELDKARNLRFSFKAFVLIEKQLGKLSKLDLENIGFEEMAVILHAGLVHEDKNLTVDGVISLIDEHSTIEKVTKAISEAFENSMPKNEEAPTEMK